MTNSDTSFIRSLGRVHFIGIGGIGMSALAELMHRRGHQVQGSDARANAQTERLQKLGIKVFIGQKAQNVKQAQLVVVSSAIAPSNAEYKTAQKQGARIVARGEMLAALTHGHWTIAIAGSHGKTTTTSLVASILESAKLAPSVVNGGIMQQFGSNARLGKSRFMVVEADESDGSFLALSPDIAVVTNMDAEHLGHYGNSFAKMREAFVRFTSQTQLGGCVVLGTDSGDMRQLAKKQKGRCITYGLHQGADVQAVKLRVHANGTNFHLRLREGKKVQQSADWTLAMLGQHNVQNALAAIAVARALDIPLATIKKALRGFRGTHRRFHLVGQWRGVQIYDDYAHHPAEIKACLAGAKGLGGRVVAVVEPHRYSRLQALFADYVRVLGAADMVFLLPVYTAGEKPVAKMTSTHLAQAVKQKSKNYVEAVAPPQLAKRLAPHLRAKDIVLCMGAGAVSGYAGALAKQLREVAQ